MSEIDKCTRHDIIEAHELRVSKAIEYLRAASEDVGVWADFDYTLAIDMDDTFYAFSAAFTRLNLDSEDLATVMTSVLARIRDLTYVNRELSEKALNTPAVSS